MSTSRAAVVCGAIERREAAFMHAAAIAAAAYRRRSVTEVENVMRSRASLCGAAVWTAVTCTSMHLRTIGGAAAARALNDAAEIERERSARHGIERCKWAQLRRGLERRAARRAFKERLWAD